MPVQSLTTGAPWSDAGSPEEAAGSASVRSERGVAAARAALREEAPAAAWEEGRAMTLDQAATFALEEITPSPGEGDS